MVDQQTHFLAAIAAITGQQIAATQRFPGGDISGATRIELTDGSIVVAKQGPVVSVEAAMLRSMARATTPSPKVIGCRDDVLVIEHLPDDGKINDAWASLAKALHGLRGIPGEFYGWHENYALRHVVVENATRDNWPDFWADNRLRCHIPFLPVSLGRRVEMLADALPELLPLTPLPAFVHGDLWGGNILTSNNSVTGLIDPCACYGHHEVDAATLTVFDHPPDGFFNALELETGWRERQPIYRLPMWLIYIRLFGEAYRSAAEGELAGLRF